MKPKETVLKLIRAFLGCALAVGIGASFSQAATVTISDGNWTTVGSGLSSFVTALAGSGGQVYAGGLFTMANNGTLTVNRVARWNGSSWSAMGSGVSTLVFALATSGSDVYVGGLFTVATNSGGAVVTAYRIARWNGSSWSAVGGGVNSQVSALAASGSDLYAGGQFVRATNSGVAVAANRIAKWNGSSWSAMGSGMNDQVYAIAVSGSDVYAGGAFTNAGGSAANYIAKWDGNSWSALGSGMNSNVYALAVLGSDLYAGGTFTNAGGSAANYIAKWDGISWSALGSGVNGGGSAASSVRALAVSGSDLYVVGNFTNAGGIAANYIAKWSDSSWSALGSGMNMQVNALWVSGSDLYAGGVFTTTGSKPIQNIARAYLLPLPSLSVLPSGPEVLVSWPSADTDGFTLEQAAGVSAPSGWVSNSGSISDDGTNKSVSVPAANGAQFFRLRRP